MVRQHALGVILADNHANFPQGIAALVQGETDMATPASFDKPSAPSLRGRQVVGLIAEGNCGKEGCRTLTIIPRNPDIDRNRL